ncbi:MAG: ABC transporter ATP-binding protein [Lachnospiraceae bacterium]|nr:ABC transporter ATP-binding protein [Lachnospiraceae bacterium]
MTEKEKQKKHGGLKNLKRAVGTLMKDTPGLLPMAVVCAVLSAGTPYIDIILSAEILTELADPARDMNHLIFLAFLLVGLNFLGRELLNFCWQFLDVLKYVEMKKLNRAVAAKAWQMDYAMNEDPEISEKKENMSYWHYGRGLLAMAEQFQNFLRGVFTIGISAALAAEFFAAKAAGESGMAAVVNHWSVSVLFVVLFVLSTAHGIFSSARIQKHFYQANEDSKRPFNQMTGLLQLCAEYPNGKDIRMFGAGEHIRRKIEEKGGAYVRISERVNQYARRMGVSATLSYRLFEMLVYLFVGIKAVYGAFGVGSILKYTGTVTRLGIGVSGLVDSVRDFAQNMHYVDDYFAFQDMPNRTATGERPITREMKNDYIFTFRDVTFTYPGAHAPSLSGINCSFRKGEKLAIVGRNGSGKSTFIKLLCRLYDPQEGQILLNGEDIREYRYEEYLEFFSTVFQDYMIFGFQLGENVAAESEYDEEKAVKALQDAGFGERLETMPDGLKTQLFNFFSEDGVELSGGESQKVAIARCLYKDAPYVVMDEPTAALDPVGEADIYQRMNRFTRDKGAIYISHRLSSCHFCDRILVFEEGKIAEQGTHRALLDRNGLYRKLWDAQARYYA